MLVPRKNATPRAGILITKIFDGREESGLWRSLGPAMRKSNTEGSLRCRSLNPTEVPSARTTGDACRVRAPFPDGVRRSPRPNSRPTEPAMAICPRPHRGSRPRTRILPYNRVVVTTSGRRRVVDYVFTIVISRLAATVGRLTHLVGAGAELPHAERPDVVRREPFDRISEQEAVSDRSVFDPHRVRVTRLYRDGVDIPLLGNLRPVRDDVLRCPEVEHRPGRRLGVAVVGHERQRVCRFRDAWTGWPVDGTRKLTRMNVVDRPLRLRGEGAPPGP